MASFLVIAVTRFGGIVDGCSDGPAFTRIVASFCVAPLNPVPSWAWLQDYWQPILLRSDSRLKMGTDRWWLIPKSAL